MAEHTHQHTHGPEIDEVLRTVSIEKGERSLVTITGEVPFSALEKHRGRALKELGKNVELDGFRKGHVPEKILLAHIGEMTLLTEMAERALADVYPEILSHKEIDAIGHPNIAITKLAAGNPLGFKATVAIVPDIALPDYLSIARQCNSERESATVTEEDLTTAIERTMRQKLAYDRIQEKARQKAEAEKNGLTLPTPETADAGEDYSALPLPELTDAYVKTLGDFTDIADFKTKLRAHLEREKMEEVIGKHRARITDAIIEKTTLDMPEILINAELDQMFAQMEADLARANLTLAGYLTHIKKTTDDLRKDWESTAKKRAALQLVLNAIAKKENVTIDQKRVEQDVAHLMERYQDADPRRVTIYVESMIQNDEVMKLLERAA